MQFQTNWKPTGWIQANKFSPIEQPWTSIRNTFVKKKRLTNTKWKKKKKKASPHIHDWPRQQYQGRSFQHAFSLTSAVELGMLSSSHSWEDFFSGRAFGLTWLTVSGEGIYSYGKEQALETATGGPDCPLVKKNGESKCKGQKLWWMFVFKVYLSAKVQGIYLIRNKTLVA